MLAFDFDYYLPDTAEEAADIYISVQKEGKAPLYYGGGTEIISMSRVFSIRPGAVIDYKNIPECRGVETDGAVISIGAAATLNDIVVSGLYPLLGLAAGRVADHTVQCKITLGGNLAGTIRYHETLPPLLLADSTVHLAGPYGSRQAPISDIFGSKNGLAPGELIVRVSFDKKYASLPYIHIKKSKIEKIGYPLITFYAIYNEDTLSCAVSGMCDHPFRFNDINIINGYSASDLALQMSSQISQPVLDDIGGSAAYRSFILKKTMEKAIMKFRGR